MLNSNSEELQSSITKFEQMLKTNRVSFFDAQEFEDLIVHYLSFGDISLAKKALQLGLNQHPSNIELMLLQSELFIMDEKFKAAVELLDYVEKISPLNEEVLLQRSAIASKKGDHKKSIELLHLALEITDEPIEIWNLLGMEHLLAENFREALYFFKNCLLEDTEDYPALYNLLYCYEQLKETDEAISVLNDLLEKDPYNEI
ncbi:tetratricopeptide repeat protein, partial [Flavobacteriaceae bacterium]|nr:tetratricopeptide repeat protein [Flavobacteriaceae bacterium]